MCVRCMGGVWEVYGMCVCVSEVFMSCVCEVCVGCVCEVYGRCMGGVCEVYVRCM